MAKAKKKRNKKYTGKDAALDRPNITRVQAANRSKLGQWWYEHKRAAKPIIIIALVILAIIMVVIGIVSLVSGS